MSSVVRVFLNVFVILALTAGTTQALPLGEHSDNALNEHQHFHAADHEHEHGVDAQFDIDGHVSQAPLSDASSCCHPVEVAHSCHHQITGYLEKWSFPEISLLAESRSEAEVGQIFYSTIVGPLHRPPIPLLSI